MWRDIAIFKLNTALAVTILIFHVALPVFGHGHVTGAAGGGMVDRVSCNGTTSAVVGALSSVETRREVHRDSDGRLEVVSVTSTGRSTGSSQPRYITSPVKKAEQAIVSFVRNDNGLMLPEFAREFVTIADGKRVVLVDQGQAQTGDVATIETILKLNPVLTVDEVKLVKFTRHDDGTASIDGEASQALYEDPVAKARKAEADAKQIQAEVNIAAAKKTEADLFTERLAAERASDAEINYALKKAEEALIEKV